MPSFPKISDLRLSGWWDSHSRGDDIRNAAACQHPAIKTVALNYAQQIDSAISFPGVLGWAFAQGTWHGRSEMAARRKVWGITGEIDRKAPDFSAKIKRYKTIVTRLRRGKSYITGVEEGVSLNPERMKKIASFNDFQSMMFSQLVLVWAIFEATARDLWIEAVNLHPTKLAKPTDKISIENIRCATDKNKPHDLTGKIGSALAMDREFISLRKIRAAYGETFKKGSGQINVILGRNCLDQLSLIRNVIVHNGSKMDAEYEREHRTKFRMLPKPEIGSKIIANGAMLKRLIIPVRQCGTDLFGAIDLWLTRHLR
jgi:hypothetical protein